MPWPGTPTSTSAGGVLVSVVETENPTARNGEGETLWQICPLTEMLVREALATHARFVLVQRVRKQEVDLPRHPPEFCYKTLHQRRGWPGIRHLNGLAEYPVLCPDGTLLLTPGYDQRTGLYLTGDYACLNIPDRPTRAQAGAAVNSLKEIVQDFPFGEDCHFAAWVAGLLTPLARTPLTARRRCSSPTPTAAAAARACCGSASWPS